MGDNQDSLWGGRLVVINYTVEYHAAIFKHLLIRKHLQDQSTERCMTSFTVHEKPTRAYVSGLIEILWMDTQGLQAQRWGEKGDFYFLCYIFLDGLNINVWIIILVKTVKVL